MEAARREQAVGRRLRLQVGELIRVEVADQHLAVARQQFAKRRGLVVVLEDAPDGVAEQSCLACHPPRQIGRVVDRGVVGGGERIQQRPHGIAAAALRGVRAAAVESAEASSLAQLALGVPAELQIVGEDQVGESFAVALELVAPLGSVEVLADVLALDMSDWHAAPLDDEIGRASLDARGLVDRLGAIAAQRFDQRLERGAVAVLRRLSTVVGLPQRLAVGAQGLVRGLLLRARAHGRKSI